MISCHLLLQFQSHPRWMNLSLHFSSSSLLSWSTRVIESWTQHTRISFYFITRETHSIVACIALDITQCLGSKARFAARQTLARCLPNDCANCRDQLQYHSKCRERHEKNGTRMYPNRMYFSILNYWIVYWLSACAANGALECQVDSMPSREFQFYCTHNSLSFLIDAVRF